MTDTGLQLEIVGWALGIGAAITAIVWVGVWIGVERSIRGVPTLRRGQSLAVADPPTGRVCVIVPVHNEQRVIARFVRSLRAETYPQLRVVLALDRCTDDTASLVSTGIASDGRFEVIDIDSCPDDWAGKVHAVHVGVTRSIGAQDAEYLLFVDADTAFEPGCIAAALALMRQRQLDLLSLLSTLTHDAWFERVVQTAAALELMRQYPLTRANGLDPWRAFANGQFMLFRRAAYDAVGGHAAVQRALLEDLALARLIVHQRRKPGVFFAAGLFRCRMYADWAQFRRGWIRIYTEATNRKASRLSFSSLRIRVIGTVLPLWTLGCALFGALLAHSDVRGGWWLLAISLAASLVWLGSLMRVTGVAEAPAWTAPLHVIGAWLTGGLLAQAADDLRSRRPTQWGGREYDVSKEQTLPVQSPRNLM